MKAGLLLMLTGLLLGILSVTLSHVSLSILSAVSFSAGYTKSSISQHMKKNNEY